MALTENQKLNQALSKRWQFLYRAFSSPDSASAVTAAIEKSFKAANPTHRHEGPTMVPVIEGAWSQVNVDRHTVYEKIDKLGIHTNRYMEFLLQVSTPDVFHEILSNQPAEDVTHALNLVQIYEKAPVRDARELAVLFSNANFNALLVTMTGVAVALGGDRFQSEVIPHIELLDHQHPNYRTLKVVQQFISQSTEETGGISLSDPVRSVNELPARLQLAFGPRENQNSLTHFLFADHLAAFKAKRRCPFAPFVEREFHAIDHGFTLPNITNRFINKVARVRGRSQ